MVSGLKELVQYGNELAKPNFEDYGTVRYTDKRMYELDCLRRAEAIKMSTLTSLVDYIKSNIDGDENKMIIQVVSPTEVQLISELDADRKRENLVNVVARIPDFPYGRYIEKERFVIALQSKFLKGEDRDLLLKFAGTVENGTVSQYKDDGVTQKATIRTGIASKGEAEVPNPVTLRPFRTFVEVDQPESSFVFRMKQNDRNEVECAVFEADGGAWMNEAMRRIKEYLRKELQAFPQYIIIS